MVDRPRSFKIHLLIILGPLKGEKAEWLGVMKEDGKRRKESKKQPMKDVSC